jgi:phosphoglucosamine mutase
MLEPALTAGFVAAGVDVILLGPIPTPGVALMTRSLRADLGVMISASHNPYHDNGIKFFNMSGFKIQSEDELKISEIFHANSAKLAPVECMGKARRLDDASGRYAEFAKNSFPKNLNLMGLKIAIDTANGAAYKIAPQVFWELGADVVKIGHEPNGLNINKNCGATDLAKLQETVRKTKADVGIALDGDGDRVMMVDETGSVMDGDCVIAGIATDWSESGRMRSRKIVATQMSNIGLEKYLNGIGLELIKSEVGDKYVLEKMQKVKAQLGGEKSGHVIPIDYVSTGDGLISALQILAYISRKKLLSSAVRQLFEPYPQAFKNIGGTFNLSASAISALTSKVEKEILGGQGRVVIRRSGTEDVMRIMAESASKANAERAVAEIEKVLICQG